MISFIDIASILKVPTVKTLSVREMFRTDLRVRQMSFRTLSNERENDRNIRIFGNLFRTSEWSFVRTEG